MNSFIQNNGILPADVIIVPKSILNIVEHYVVYLGEDDWGNDIYAENKIGYGVRTLYHDQFATENPSFKRIRRFSGDDYQRDLAVTRALSVQGKKYDMTNFNCEHYANFVQYYQTQSQQVNTGILVGLVALVLFGITAAAASK